MVPSARQTREGWDLLIASTLRRAPQEVRSLRCIDGLFLMISAGDDWESSRNEVAAGMNSAAIAPLVTG